MRKIFGGFGLCFLKGILNIWKIWFLKTLKSICFKNRNALLSISRSFLFSGSGDDTFLQRVLGKITSFHGNEMTNFAPEKNSHAIILEPSSLSLSPGINKTHENDVDGGG